ncbi:MAG: two-component sensor histidine kinase [Clostridiales bacterium]|nr:MAG: two-component sensor histidine kinase [Clostridiales bacterium]
MKSHSIKSKLTRTYMLIVFTIVILFTLFISYSINRFYYGNIEKQLKDRISIVLNVYDSYIGYSSLEKKAKFILESSSIPEYVDAQIINKNGYIIESSSRFTSGKKITTPEIKSALNGKSDKWIGIIPGTYERLMAISAPLYNKNEIVGIIRFITSIEKLDNTVRFYYFIVLLIDVIILLIAFSMSVFIASKTVSPIYQLKAVADHYAIGDFDKKATKFNEDELGELSDTFNYMANEIKNTERLKNDFISSISHEIRTPLTSILGWSETLMQGGTEEENKLGLEIISKESERLTKLVEDLLDFSKLEANRIKINKDRFDLKLLIEKTAKQFYVVASKKDINITTNFEVQKLIYFGDKDRIKQVLINIIDNSLKHTFKDGNIKIELISKDKEKISIIIDDDGEGMADYHIGNVTKMFYKGNKNITGSGIGLAISNKIIELHNGSLEFNSKKTGGMKVTINLPRRDYEKSKN